MAITSQDLTKLTTLLELTRQFGVTKFKLDNLEFELGPLTKTPEALPEELPLQMPSSDELLFGHTGFLPEAVND